MSMTMTATEIPDVKLLAPKVYRDERGCFFESFNERDFIAHGLPPVRFVQDNHSMSIRNVLRGLHYQIRCPQGKLVRVVRGQVFDVAVDLRRSSPTFGKWAAATLSEENQLQMWIPPGFAHGFLALSDEVEFLYKTTDYWHAEHERTLRWDDPALGIQWPIDAAPIMAAKDRNGKVLGDAEVYE
ncbi:dTDP-4-dehydrorhamnose 3,5-epimerase [Mycetohabitans rhizoxinica]|jgi:dTDP-4-dehydrorhamnose 3,5-epimerase|uniref:dTDP-4-dehydrorhamnose 3,5-epimerase n=1 Tax=Mycetohabitans rhizoxinica TaxID=412963 RepID=UPI0030D1B20A